MDYDWITPRVALGSAIESRHDAQELVVQGITHVVNMCIGRQDEPYFRGTDVVLAYFGIFDGENEEGIGSDRIGRAIRFVDAALVEATHHRLYLHCAAGISRSAAVMVGYLMKTERLPMAEALRLVRAVRPCVNPHPAHMMSLLEIFSGAGGLAAQNETPTWRYGPQV